MTRGKKRKTGDGAAAPFRFVNGRCQLMAKIKEITSTRKKEHPGEVESKLENSSPKCKITTLDKIYWDAKSRILYLEK